MTMQIQGINIYNKKYNNSIGQKRSTPTFTSSSRDYYDKSLIKTTRTWGNVATTTWMFRQDLDWNKFTEFVYKNFASKNKVNTYSLACSDGSEAYTFLISILEKLPKETIPKFSPIIATDRDFEIIKAARSGKINLAADDIARINIISGFKEYFINKSNPMHIKNNNFSLQCHAYEPIKELRDKVIFKQIDLLNHLKQIKDEGNSIVFCRNVTPYLPQNDIFKLANTASEILKKGSLIVFGEFDKHSGILDFIDIKGFEECMEFVFRKI